MATVEYEEALAYLQKNQTTDGSSVYEHLTHVLLKVLEERPSHALDLLETSLIVKKTVFDAKESSPLVPVTSAADTAKAVACANLFGNPDLPIDPDTGEPVEAEAPNEYECEDVMRDAYLFDAVGVGLGKQEMYNVMLTVKKLGEDPKKEVQTVRFYGKFLGILTDYYVFETTLKSAPEETEETLAEGQAPKEAVGTGANGYTYFVCNYLGGPFTKLPDVTPAQIKAARTIRKFLTGKLDAPVSTYPWFPGTEANFLRAQIARIAATTVCCPGGMFVAGEEGAIDKAEEYEAQPTREYASPVNWSHRYMHLKKQGRCVTFKREVPEEEEDTFEFTEEELEEGPELLATLDADAEVAAGPAWSPVLSSSSEAVKSQVAGIRSNLWPGAVCVCQGTSFSNVYVGWGLKNAEFVPLPPPPVSKEYDQAMVESAELPPKPEPEAAAEGAEDE